MGVTNSLALLSTSIGGDALQRSDPSPVDTLAPASARLTRGHLSVHYQRDINRARDEATVLQPQLLNPLVSAPASGAAAGFNAHASASLFTQQPLHSLGLFACLFVALLIILVIVLIVLVRRARRRRGSSSAPSLLSWTSANVVAPALTPTPTARTAFLTLDNAHATLLTGADARDGHYEPNHPFGSGSMSRASTQRDADPIYEPVNSERSLPQRPVLHASHFPRQPVCWQASGTYLRDYQVHTGGGNTFSATQSLACQQNSALVRSICHFCAIERTEQYCTSTCTCTNNNMWPCMCL